MPTCLTAQWRALIHTGRGPQLDHEAPSPRLTAAISAAMIDVTDPEPLPAGHPFLVASEVI